MAKTADEKIVGIIANFWGGDPSEVTPNANLVDDLEMDSLDIVEAVMEVEEEFDLEISDDDAITFKTVADIQKYVAGRGVK